MVIDGGIKSAHRAEPADKPASLLDPNAIAATPAIIPNTATAQPAAAAIFQEIVFPTTKNEYTL